MSAHGSSASSGGIGFLGLLGLLFIGLKLAHVIAWPWWAVLSPLWGPIALVLAGVLVFAVLRAVWRSVRR